MTIRSRLLKIIERWTVRLERWNKRAAALIEKYKNVRPVPAGYQLKPTETWLPHQGKQERQRRVRHSFHRANNLKDPASRNAMERLKRWASTEEDPFPVIWQVCHTAWSGVDATGKTWAEVVNFLIDDYERKHGGRTS